MATHVKVCAGQAGYSLIFDQSVVNYQENFNKISDVPFSVYYDFETTTRSAIYSDAKMYVVSYYMIVAFHAELKMIVPFLPLTNRKTLFCQKFFL